MKIMLYFASRNDTVEIATPAKSARNDKGMGEKWVKKKTARMSGGKCWRWGFTCYTR